MRRLVLGLMIAMAIATALPGPTFAQSTPQFVLGFKTLADLIPTIVGQPLENEHFDPQTGDALQMTTSGLLVWRKADNFTAFTDGSTTWINGPFGLQSRPNDARFDWEPAVPPPPPAVLPSPPPPLPRPPSTIPPTPHPDNWSGYAATSFSTGQIYSSVGGSWTVPTAKVPPGQTFGFSANWVGIGGACLNSQCSSIDPTLIQIGTEQDAGPDGTLYAAWYEMLPAEPVAITSLTINPGDKISATVQMTGGNQLGLQTWQLTMTDTTSGQSFSTTVQYRSSLASADWILEAPFAGTVLPLADYGTATFDPGMANGTNPHLTGSQGLVMVNPNGQTSNVSSPDSDTDGFSTCWGSGRDLTPCPSPGS